MRIAVVGGGVFGCTAAVELALAGYKVDLFERHSDLMQGASRCNQGRLHMGYHYPRSPETVRACKRSALEFMRRFPDAIEHGVQHHYAIASEGSQTSADEYLAFCEREKLFYEIVSPWLFASSDVCVKVPEKLIDLEVLRILLRRLLSEVGVQIHLKSEPLVGRYDWAVDATYLSNDRQRRFEVCEIALVTLPRKFLNLSLVTLDGPFCSLDPVPGHFYHMLYDVEHSVHHAVVGRCPPQLTDVVPLLDTRPVRYSKVSHVPAMLQTLSRFLPEAAAKATYLGSMFTIRSVPAGVEDTDARPTLVERTGNVVTVLGGKLDTCLEAARQVVFEISEAVALSHANVVFGE